MNIPIIIWEEFKQTNGQWIRNFPEDELRWKEGIPYRVYVQSTIGGGNE